MSKINIFRNNTELLVTSKQASYKSWNNTLGINIVYMKIMNFFILFKSYQKLQTSKWGVDIFHFF